MNTNTHVSDLEGLYTCLKHYRLNISSVCCRPQYCSYLKPVLLYKCTNEELLSKLSFLSAYCLRACELIPSAMFRLILWHLALSSLRAQQQPFQTASQDWGGVEVGGDGGKWIWTHYPYCCICFHGSLTDDILYKLAMLIQFRKVKSVKKRRVRAVSVSVHRQSKSFEP